MSEGHSITLSPTKTRYSKKQSSPSLSPNMSTNPLQCAGTEFASPYHSEFDEELYHSMMDTPRTQGVNMAAQSQEQPPVGYPKRDHGEDVHQEEGNQIHPNEGQGMHMATHIDNQDRGIVSNTLGAMSNAAYNVAGTAINVATNRILPTYIGHTGAEIVAGTLNHYISPSAPKINLNLASTPAFHKMTANEEYEAKLAAYRWKVKDKDNQMEDCQREMNRIRMDNLRLKNAQEAAVQEAMTLTDRCEAATKLTNVLQETVQNQSGQLHDQSNQLQAMQIVLDQILAEKEVKAKKESGRISPNISPGTNTRSLLPTSPPKSTSFMRGITSAVSGLASATSSIIIPALIGHSPKNTSKDKVGKINKDPFPSQEQEQLKPLLDQIVIGTPVPTMTKTLQPIQHDIFSPQVRSVLPTPSMMTREEVKVEPSAPKLPTAQESSVHTNPFHDFFSQPMIQEESKVPVDKIHVHVSTPYPQLPLSQFPLNYAHTLLPATKLEAPMVSYGPTTSYVPPGMPSTSYIPPYVPHSSYIPPCVPSTAYIPTYAPHTSYIPPYVPNPSYIPQYVAPTPQPALLPPMSHTLLPNHQLGIGAHTPQGIVGSSKPMAHLSESQLKIHNTAPIPNAHNFVNPMHQTQENHYVNPLLQTQAPGFTKLLPETPPNLGHGRPVNRKPESIHSNHSHQSHQTLLGNHHHPSAEVPEYHATKLPSRMSNNQGYQNMDDAQDVSNKTIQQNTKKDSTKKPQHPHSHRRRKGDHNGDSPSSSDHDNSPKKPPNKPPSPPKPPNPPSPSNSNTSYTNTYTSVPSTSKSKSPRFPNQLMKFMKQQNDAVFAICNTMQDNNANKTSRPDKFKINYNLQLKHVKLSKGERITAAFVIKTLTAAKEIDLAVNKASTRKPQTTSEWQSFFKFHLAHMTDILHEEMSTIVLNHDFTDSHTFWTQVFKKIFPNEIAMDAFDKALSSYMVWNEPLGIERWEAITKNLLAHKAVMSGKAASEIHMYMAEGLANQLQRLVMACPELYSAPLFEKYTNVYAEVLEHRDDGTPVPYAMYDLANVRFLRQLKMKAQCIPRFHNLWPHFAKGC
jgi:hypothetical protein